MHRCCGKSIIPAIVHKASEAHEAKKAQGETDEDEEAGEKRRGKQKKDKKDKKEKSEPLKKVEEGGAEWANLTQEERRILIARRRILGSLSFDILYERLPHNAEPLNGVK